MKFIKMETSETSGGWDYWELKYNFIASVSEYNGMVSIYVEKDCSNLYTLCLMPNLPTNEKPEKGKIYLEKYKNKMRYRFLRDEHMYGDFLDINIDEPLTKEFLENKKSEIFNIISKKGHTRSDHTEQVLIKLLQDPNYAYITQGYSIDAIFIECPSDKLKDVLIKIEEICKTL